MIDCMSGRLQAKELMPQKVRLKAKGKENNFLMEKAKTKVVQLPQDIPKAPRRVPGNLKEKVRANLRVCPSRKGVRKATGTKMLNPALNGSNMDGVAILPVAPFHITEKINQTNLYHRVKVKVKELVKQQVKM